jgi:GT2 family glycosyltransferase
VSWQLTVPPAQAPEASVVLVLHNAWEWSARAMRALVDNTDAGSYELIVVDNASQDGTAAGLDRLDGAVILRNAANAGFGIACNQGAVAARGRHLVLLNSDALVHPGWLPALLDVADSDARVGAVGARLLNLDGTLQEAGTIVWGDGLVNNYGDGDDPARPEYGFVRDVDYVSAACLLVRRSAFVDAGGFDPVYAPAYLEDVDLCFGLRAAGMRVVYQPFATATHVRWASGERSETQRLVQRNLPVFRERWAAELRRRPHYPGVDDRRIFLEARDAQCTERVLVVAAELPGDEAPAMVQRACRAAGADRATTRTTLLLATDAGDAGKVEGLQRAGVEVVVAAGPDAAAWLE